VEVGNAHLHEAAESAVSAPLEPNKEGLIRHGIKTAFEAEELGAPFPLHQENSGGKIPRAHGEQEEHHGQQIKAGLVRGRLQTFRGHGQIPRS